MVTADSEVICDTPNHQFGVLRDTRISSGLWAWIAIFFGGLAAIAGGVMYVVSHIPEDKTFSGVIFWVGLIASLGGWFAVRYEEKHRNDPIGMHGFVLQAGKAIWGEFKVVLSSEDQNNQGVAITSLDDSALPVCDLRDEITVNIVLGVSDESPYVVGIGLTDSGQQLEFVSRGQGVFLWLVSNNRVRLLPTPAMTPDIKECFQALRMLGDELSIFGEKVFQTKLIIFVHRGGVVQTTLSAIVGGAAEGLLGSSLAGLMTMAGVSNAMDDYRLRKLQELIATGSLCDPETSEDILSFAQRYDWLVDLRLDK